MKLFFSEYYEVDKKTLDEYGAVDVSLITDVPLFVDPFLLFNSENPEYQQLHAEIIKYLKFLRAKSEMSGDLSKGELDAWYKFSEVSQNWLGFTVIGNQGSGLGSDFAQSLHDNLHSIFSDFGKEEVTSGSHLEKLCLIKEGVGKDSISDFTTNLIKGYLLEYTQTFAATHIDPKFIKSYAVERAEFNYKTESWATKTYKLPHFVDDYVLLTPKDMLTKDETWINKTDLVDSFRDISNSVSNEELAAKINNYFNSVLVAEPTKKEERSAAEATIREFPELVDHYIKLKEDDKDGATAVSREKIEQLVERLIEPAKALMELLGSSGDFYDQSYDTLDESIKRANHLKHQIELGDGYKVVNPPGAEQPWSEKDIQWLYTLVWFGTIFDFNREANNGLGPPDFMVSLGSIDKTIIEFKLASNKQLEHGLTKQTDVYLKVNKTKKKLIVIVAYTEGDMERAERIIGDLGLGDAPHVILVDARNDNKPSASRA